MRIYLNFIYLEDYIPNPFIGVAPGAKLGLANIIGLITLVMYGFKYAKVGYSMAIGNIMILIVVIASILRRKKIIELNNTLY